MLYRKMIKPDPPVLKKNVTHSLSHDPIPPRQSVRLNGDLRAASLGTITTDLQPMSVKRL